MNEYWIDVKGREDECQVSNFGRIRLINIGSTQLVNGAYVTTIIPEHYIDIDNPYDADEQELIDYVKSTHPRYFAHQSI